jgi:putative endonuclease
MTVKNQDLGRLGELKAVKFLENNGFSILECNWRYKHLELDIIAKKENMIIIFEVKTRSTNFFGEPESFVSLKKQALLMKAADAYIQINGINLDVRFDIISIISPKSGKITLKHIENAFYPTVN